MLAGSCYHHYWRQVTLFSKLRENQSNRFPGGYKCDQSGTEKNHSQKFARKILRNSTLNQGLAAQIQEQTYKRSTRRRTRRLCLLETTFLSLYFFLDTTSRALLSKCFVCIWRVRMFDFNKSHILVKRQKLETQVAKLLQESLWKSSNLKHGKKFIRFSNHYKFIYYIYNWICLPYIQYTYYLMKIIYCFPWMPRIYFTNSSLSKRFNFLRESTPLRLRGRLFQSCTTVTETIF